jgi:hypothetical protein
VKRASSSSSSSSHHHRFIFIIIIIMARSSSNSSSNSREHVLERKSRKRREANKNKNRGDGLPLTEVVCTAQGVVSSKNSVELGLILSLLVVGLYLYGFYASIMALPDVDVDVANFNIAKRQRQQRRRQDNSRSASGVLFINEQELLLRNTNIHNHHDPQEEEDEQPILLVPPFATWPVTQLRDEERNNEFETIVHPGDMQTEMSVPKFWSPPLENQHQPFTREQAMKVGTCVEPDPKTGSHVRGDNCPPPQRTIFLAIASYRDFQCRFTVESVFTRAQYPERVRVGEFSVFVFLCWLDDDDTRDT